MGRTIICAQRGPDMRTIKLQLDGEARAVRA